MRLRAPRVTLSAYRRPPGRWSIRFSRIGGRAFLTLCVGRRRLILAKHPDLG